MTDKGVVWLETELAVVETSFVVPSLWLAQLSVVVCKGMSRTFSYGQVVATPL